MKSIIGIIAGIIALSSLFTGCNPYSVVDKPSGDIQTLSAARACFDQGDFTCSLNYYAQLSSAQSDQQNAETAFLLLAQNGAPITSYVNAVVNGSSSGGKLITLLSNSLTQTPSLTNRLAYFHAYQKNTAIIDTKSQGLVRFVASLALIAELLGEDASTSGNLLASDIVKNPTECLTNMNSNPITFASLIPNTGCEKPTGKLLTTGSPLTSLDAITSDTSMSGTPTLYMIDAAINSAEAGLNQMDTSGSLGSTTLSFTQKVLQAGLSGGSGDSPFFRGTLILLGVGAN